MAQRPPCAGSAKSKPWKATQGKAIGKTQCWKGRVTALRTKQVCSPSAPPLLPFSLWKKRWLLSPVSPVVVVTDTILDWLAQLWHSKSQSPCLLSASATLCHWSERWPSPPRCKIYIVRRATEVPRHFLSLLGDLWDGVLWASAGDSSVVESITSDVQLLHLKVPDFQVHNWQMAEQMICLRTGRQTLIEGRRRELLHTLQHRNMPLATVFLPETRPGHVELKCRLCQHLRPP